MKQGVFIAIFVWLAVLVNAQSPARITSSDTKNLRVDAIRNFAQAKYIDCILNCQKMVALGEGDGLVAGLMAMAYDSLRNDQAGSKAHEEAQRFKPQDEIYNRIASANLTPELYQRQVLSNGASSYNVARFDSSEFFFKEYLKLVPKDTFALYYLANAQFYQGKYDEALVNYRSILDLNFNRSDVHNLVGVCYMVQNNYLTARNYFCQSILLDKLNGMAHYNLGRIHFGLNDKTAALVSLEQAFILMPKDSNTVALIAQIYLEQHDLKNAEKYLARLYAINRNNEKVGWNLVNIAQKNNDYVHAASYLQNIIRMNPKNPQAYSELGKAYISNKSFEEAFNSYETALQKLGESRDFLYGAGMCANKIGIYGKAVEFLNKAVTYDAGYANTYQALGDAYTGLGKTKLALKNYKLAAGLGYKTDDQPTGRSSKKK
jgi:tetratricopeptide (TPR) repeat protein